MASLFGLPKEIRLQIFGYLINFDSLKAGKWFAHTIFAISRQAREDAISTIYGTRDLIFDLPKFAPHFLGFGGEWPSMVHIHDQYNTFATSLPPRFLCPGVFDYKDNLERLERCPFHLFRTIEIEIYPPNPEDAAELIMTWNRLRFITRILQKSKKGLPQVRVAFSESATSSWFGSNGKLNVSHSDLAVLQIIKTDEVSDLMLLMGTLMPLRYVRDLVLRTSFSDSKQVDYTCEVLIEDLMESAARNCKWGSNLHLELDDLFYIHWLERCDLQFHDLLQSLDTPIAPFLRLEQLSSLRHFEFYKFDTLSRECGGFPLSTCIWGIFAPLFRCAYVFCPRNRFGLCRKPSTKEPPDWAHHFGECCCSDTQLTDHEIMDIDNDPPIYCPELSECRRWKDNRIQREVEIDQYYDHLKGIGRSPCNQELPQAGNQTNMSDDEQTESDLEGITYSRCDCFSVPARIDWFKFYPEGIRHEQRTIQSIITESTCKISYSMWDENFNCLPDSGPP